MISKLLAKTTKNPSVLHTEEVSLPSDMHGADKPVIQEIESTSNGEFDCEFEQTVPTVCSL